MTVSAHTQWRLAARPQGLPKSSDFEWVEAPLPEPAEGQFLIRVIYLSIDPTNRIWMAGDSYLPAVPTGEVMRGIALGVVQASRHEGFAEGDIVQGLFGWQSHCLSEGKGVAKLPKLPIPLSAHFGLLGHIGFTAYFGLLDIGEPKPGETLVVSAAAGAVGSLAAQIGKLKGCRVVGIAGSDEKCEWLTGTLGLDAAVNYRTQPLREALAAACPDGIDIYFENVGGKTLEAVLSLVNIFARIPVCGMISQYNADAPSAAPKNLATLIMRRVKMQGFLVTDYMPRFAEAAKELIGWNMMGKLQYRLDVVDGLENAPDALLKLFDGSNKGKLLVRVSPES